MSTFDCAATPTAAPAITVPEVRLSHFSARSFLKIRRARAAASAYTISTPDTMTKIIKATCAKTAKVMACRSITVGSSAR
jgi:hypothetical protein